MTSLAAGERAPGLLSGKVGRMGKGVMAGQVGDQGLGRMNALLGTALAVNRVLLVREGRDELLRQVCAALVAGGVADRAWIVLSSRRGKLQAMAGAGLPEPVQEIELAWRREGVPSCVQELMNSEGGPVRLIRSLAGECGGCRLGCDGAAGVGVAVRIEYRGRGLGVMTVVIPAAMAMVEEELGLFSDLAAGLGRALHEMGEERRRVAALEALRRTQERLSLATSGTGIGIWDYDVVRDRLEWDAQMFRLSGVDPATFGHRLADWSRCLLPEALPRAMAALEAAMRGEEGGGFAIKFPVRLPDGGIRHLAGRGKVVFGDDGQALRIAGVNVDVTAQHESEVRFRAIFENAAVAIYLHDAETGAILDANQRALRSFGVQTLRELCEGPSLWLPPPYSHADYMEKLHLAAASGTQRFEWQSQDRAGRLFWEDVLLQPVVLNGAVRVIQIAVEITERKAAEDALRRSEATLQRVFEILPVGLWFADREGRLLRGNPAGVRIWGAEPSVGPPDYGVFRAWRLPSREEVGPDDWALLKTVRDGVTVSGELLEIEAFDGQRRIILNHTSPVSDGHGGIDGAVIVNQDVTELVKAQEAMRASQGELMAIYENAPLQLILFDAGLKVRKANRHWPEGLRRSVGEVVGKSCGDAFCCRHAPEHPDGCGHGEACAQCPIRRALQETLASGQPCNMKEVELTSRDGVAVALMFSAARLVIHGEQMVLASALDITRQRREQAERAMLEDQLRQSQKMEAVGRLAGGVAHDFNNLLSVILGYAEMSLMRADTQGAQAEAMRQIAEAGRRSVELTRQLLSFSRRQALSPQVVDLGKVVRSQAKLLGRLIGEDIRVEVEIAKEVWEIYVDPGQVYQILANLAVNSRDAIAGVGMVSIQVGNVAMPSYFSPLCGVIAAGDYVRLVFKDTGAGMDAATCKRIFEPFFSTKLPEQGTGLGLSIVFNVVKQCGGDIQVGSQPGRGTTFSLLFPRHLAPAGKAGEREAVADALARGNETVLLVEDDELVLQLAGDILADLGYRVLPANGAEAACELARRHDGPLHLLLTDVIMPGVGGRDLQVMLEAIRPGIRTLFMSGYPPDVLAGRGGFGEECSVVAIQKPFTMESLGRKVRETLDRG